jgi:chromosome segregation ATPase
MARTGLYQSDVKRARDALVARGQNPSLDAVRVELGNTGSKTTIHKYLRELEAEEGGITQTASLSDELQAIVASLAGRLQGEADTRIAAVQAECTAQIQRQTAVTQELEAQLAAANKRENGLERQLAEARQLLVDTSEELQREKIARHTAEQHARGLQDRLAENEEHRKSLENKHVNARDALEHFRQAAKEQRDQEQRRHEHQVQQLQVESRQLQQQLTARQEEITRLNQDGARLVSDLLHAKQALGEAKQAAARREVEWNQRIADIQQQTVAKLELQQRLFTETRLELAGHVREIQLQQKELAALQGRHAQLLEEKITWRHERAQMEEMLRQRESE